MFEDMKELVAAYKARDPAARSTLEILLLYPGVRAVRSHRVAHWCYNHKLYFLARLISQRSRHRTGIEIHPGAKIGRRLVIDHGMGIVIGETAEIGDDCLIFHGVTLGGTGKDVGKRHPTIGNNVLIGTGAKILGPVEIGDNVRVAAGSVVLHSMPSHVTVAGVPARIVSVNGERVHPSDDLNQRDVPDILARKFSEVESRLSELEHTLEEKDS
jgi:serine O-acetyltransferase